MGKRTYKIWNERTKEAVESIVARPRSKEKVSFIDKFHTEYLEINHYNFPNDEFDVYQLVEAYDDKANLRVHRMLDGASVRCTMDVLGRVFYFCLDVLPEDFSTLESRVRKLEKKILNNR